MPMIKKLHLIEELELLKQDDKTIIDYVDCHRLSKDAEMALVKSNKHDALCYYISRRRLRKDAEKEFLCNCTEYMADLYTYDHCVRRSTQMYAINGIINGSNCAFVSLLSIGFKLCRKAEKLFAKGADYEWIEAYGNNHEFSKTSQKQLARRGFLSALQAKLQPTYIGTLQVA